MASIKEFFNQPSCDASKGVAHKNNVIKRSIISYMALRGQCTLAELAHQLHISVPTITRLVAELVDGNLVTDNGKIETPGGRRPNTFDLANSALYFAGMDISCDGIRLVLTDLRNNAVTHRNIGDYRLHDTAASLGAVCSSIDSFLNDCRVERSKVIGLGVCIEGRVDTVAGRSYKYFTSEQRSLQQVIERSVGIETLLENDTRARCYAEYFGAGGCRQKNVLYLHIGRTGVAAGIVADRKLYYGKSGFAGEFGHIPFFDNGVICSCGKKGCLETEVSGAAVESRLVTMVHNGVNTSLRGRVEEGGVHINEIIEAAKSGDELCVELIDQAAAKTGRGVALLINIFNPELVVIGGHLAAAADLFMLPMKSAANKYSLSPVYNDTAFRLSLLGEEAGAVGAAMLIRNKIIGI